MFSQRDKIKQILCRAFSHLRRWLRINDSVISLQPDDKILSNLNSVFHNVIRITGNLSRQWHLYEILASTAMMRRRNGAIKWWISAQCSLTINIYNIMTGINIYAPLSQEIRERSECVLSQSLPAIFWWCKRWDSLEISAFEKHFVPASRRGNKRE